ncbi:HNH endonuclease [Rhizobium sp. WW22]|uniref:HNH endonuclease n=1 Tax=Rhizobium sp. WW22 TaxID=3389070 RepID=UPI00399A7084
MARLSSIKPRLQALGSRIAAPSDRQEAEAERHRQRDRTQPWRRWYYTERWRQLRKDVWVRDNFTCRMSGIICCGAYPAANSPVADHIIKHNGDEALFWDIDNVQTLAKVIHDRVKQAIENGWSGDVEALIAKVMSEQGWTYRPR